MVVRGVMVVIALFAFGIGTMHWFGDFVPRTDRITVLTWRSVDAEVLDIDLSSRRFGIARVVWRAEALVDCPPPVHVTLIDFAPEFKAREVLQDIKVGERLRVWCAPDAGADSAGTDQATLPIGPRWHWFSGLFAYVLGLFCLYIAFFASHWLRRTATRPARDLDW